MSFLPIMEYPTDHVPEEPAAWDGSDGAAE
jgi:hypothetical protein